MEPKARAIIEVVKQGTGAADAQRDFDRVEGGAKKLSTSLAGVGSAVSGIAAAFAASGVVSFLRESVDAFFEQEEAAKRLEGQLRAVNQYTAEYARELGKLASEFQANSLFGDERILEVFQRLISFGASRDQLPRLTQAVLDLATGLRIDLSSAAVLVGKALAGETSTFSRYGIIIEETTDRGAKLEAVLSQVEQRFAGLAKGDIETSSGQIRQATNAWGDFKEVVGQVTIQYLTPLIKAAKDVAEAMSANAAEADLSGVKFAQMINPLIMLSKAYNALKESGDEAAEAMRKANSVAPPAATYGAGGNAAPSGITGPAMTVPVPGQLTLLSAQDQDLVRLNLPAPQPPTVFDRPGAQDLADYADEQADARRRGTTELPSMAEFERFEAERLAQIREQNHREMLQLERELTLESIASSAQRSDVAQREYDARVALYRRLAEEGRLTQQEFLDYVAEAKFELDRVMVETQGKTVSQAELLKEDLKQVGESAKQVFAAGLADSIVEGFRTGKFAMREFFSEFFAFIAKAIIQALILRAIQSAIGGIGGAANGTVKLAAAGTLMAGPIMAASGAVVPGVGFVDQATYFPRFNTVAGEAGREAFAVLARPQRRTFYAAGGVINAMEGNVGSQRLAITHASSLERAAGGGGGGLIRIQIEQSPDFEARVVQNSTGAAVSVIDTRLQTDTNTRRLVRQVARG